MTIDRDIFLGINGWETSLGPFIKFFSVALNFLAVKILLGALLIGMISAKGRPRKAALLSLGSVALANPLTDFWKHVFPTHRPFQVEELGSLVHLRVGSSLSMGTASAHSANMAAVATAMTLCLGKWGTPWIPIALITGFSRVYTGAHYPWQVLLGWITGIFAAIAVVKGYGWLEAKRSKRFEVEP